MVRAFPERTIEGKKGNLVLDCDMIRYTAWEGGLAYSEIANCTLDDNGTLKIEYTRRGKQKTTIPMKTFGNQREEAVRKFNQYYTRYLHAVAYQAQKQQEALLEQQ